MKDYEYARGLSPPGARILLTSCWTSPAIQDDGLDVSLFFGRSLETVTLSRFPGAGQSSRDAKHGLGVSHALIWLMAILCCGNFSLRQTC